MGSYRDHGYEFFILFILFIIYFILFYFILFILFNPNQRITVLGVALRCPRHHYILLSTMYLVNKDINRAPFWP